MDNKKTIENMLAEISKMISLATKELNRSPRGRLSICKEKDGTRYFKLAYREGHRIRKGIGKNEQMIYALAHKAYLQEHLSRLKHNNDILAACLRKMVDCDPSDIIAVLPDNYSLLDPAFIVRPELLGGNIFRPCPSRDVRPVALKTTIGDMSLWDWGRLPYCENTSYPEHKIHLASNGLFARSKSEVLLIEAYDRRSLPYHYDETVQIGSSWISPDFISAKRNGELVIHEHFGMDSEGYNERRRRKMDLYETAGFYQGRNLILTFDDENGAIDMRLVEAILDNVFG